MNKDVNSVAGNSPSSPETGWQKYFLLINNKAVPCMHGPCSIYTNFFAVHRTLERTFQQAGTTSMSEIHHEGGSVRLEDLTRTLSELKKEKAAGEEVIAALAGRSGKLNNTSILIHPCILTRRVFFL